MSEKERSGKRRTRRRGGMYTNCSRLVDQRTATVTKANTSTLVGTAATVQARLWLATVEMHAWGACLLQ